MSDLSGAQWAKVSNLIHAELQGRGAGQQPAAAGAVEWSDDFLRTLWRSQGGKFHGPNVETGTMPEAKLLPFLRMWLQEIATRQKQLREAEVLNAERNRQNAAAFAENDKLRSVLAELADLMDDVRTGDYAPDAFTTQPARAALRPR